jgi:RNA polymerase sigma factor (sigma-70 family)
MRTGGLETAPDVELGRAFRDGDEAALAALYDRHMSGIYDFLARLVRDPAAAEDLTQMTFVRAWEARAKLRDPVRVKAWLFTIANNLGLNHLTRRPPTDPIEEQFDLATPAPGPEAQAIAKESAELVWAAAASLEPRQYAVLDLSVRRELATPEIAQVLGVSSSHAAVLLNRAREALGNAVRYLLVARRRDHCPRLAELVPSGLESLTAEQRSSVDRHMRRCPECQGLAQRLTRPAELFGGLVALPVPASLRRERRDFVLVAARRRAGAQNPLLGWRISRPGRGPIIVALALLVLAALLAETYLNRFGASLQATGETAGYRHLGPFPSESPAPSASPSASPSVPSPEASPSSQVPANGSLTPPGTLPLSNLRSGRGQPGHLPGGNAASTPTPIPSSNQTPTPTATPTSTPTPTPPPPPFAVTKLSVTGDDPPQVGCQFDQMQLGYLCHFTVTAGLVNAQAGSSARGTLTAVSPIPGGTEKQSAPFSIQATAGATSGSIKIDLLFHLYKPCSYGPTTASAVVQQPNVVQSTPIVFGC